MKLEVGMYVRTKYNGIGKIIDYINDPTHYFFKCYKLDKDYINYEEYITEADVIRKPSFNIIDLIEIEDILEVFSDLHDLLGNEIFRIKDEKHLQHLKNGFDKGYFHLITVLTKEQFKQMSYKLEEMK